MQALEREVRRSSGLAREAGSLACGRGVELESLAHEPSNSRQGRPDCALGLDSAAAADESESHFLPRRTGKR